jgi:hypothetical protein
MTTPLDPLVADMVNALDESQREDFEERAAIMEFDAKLPRDHAECLALLDVLHRHPGVLLGVSVLRIELHGEPRWILTTDPGHARNVGGMEMHIVGAGVRDLAKLITEKYSGIAMLTAMA